MFIIDHSTSMTGGVDCQGGCDPTGTRFATTRKLIDSIAGIFPSAEVGIVIFSNGLVLNRLRDANLVTYANVEPSDSFGNNQAYMPLKPLNAAALPGGFLPSGTANPTVLDVYRSMFTQTGNNWGISGGPAEIGGTNISLAFAAALKAFEATQIDKDNRFIIFLSDGAPGLTQERAGGACTGHVWCGHANDFALNVTNTPTTYTLFLRGSAGGTVPAIITQMRDNIRASGYSATNPSSLAQAVTANTDNMLTTLKNAIFQNMPTQTASNARKISVTSVGKTDTASNIGEGFGFQRMLPIDTLDLAPVEMKITYLVQIDTVTKDGLRDSSFEYSRDDVYKLLIQRTANPSKSLTSQGLTSRCVKKPVISVWYEVSPGRLEPVSVIKPYMKRLVVRFEKNEDFFGYTPENIVIDIRTTAGSKKDTLYTTALGQPENTPAYFQWYFDREDVPDNQIVVRNSKLEHNNPNDDIVFHFRNPLIPLDEITVTIPYMSNDLVFQGRIDGVRREGYIRELRTAAGTTIYDTIKVKAGQQFDINAIVLDYDNKEDDKMLVEGEITWTLSSYDSVSFTPDGSNAVFIGRKAYTYYTVTANYVHGASGLTIERKFYIYVEPGQGEYLEVVFTDPKKTPPPAQKAVSELEKNKTLELQRDAAGRPLYLVERDKYGNLIGVTSGCWSTSSDAIKIAQGCNRDSNFVTREGSSFSAGNQIVVKKDGLRDAIVEITVVGNASTAIGPNPFEPGISDPSEVFKGPNGDAAREYYERIIDNGAIGGGCVSNCGDKGILIAGTAPKEIDVLDNGRAKSATVLIYDAVGNVVFKSGPEGLTVVSEKNTVGFVWNGKNNKGRTVGPGTYLMRMHVQLDNGRDKFVEQRKIGVKKTKK
jgi:hypothetical protein